MKTIETVGKDIEQALKAGLAELGCKLDDVEVKILEHPGIFRKARVRMTCLTGDETVEKKTAAAVMRNLEERAARVAGSGNDRGKRDGRNKNDRRERPEQAGDRRQPQSRDTFSRDGASKQNNSNPRFERGATPKDRPANAQERPERQPAAAGPTERPQKSEFRRDFRAELAAANGGASDGARKSERPDRGERPERGEHRRPEPVREVASPEALEAARGKIADYLRQLTGLMGMPSSVTTEIKEGGVEAVLTAEEENLVGARGETLEALEYLATLAANGGDGRQVRVSLDCGGFRQRLADDLARSAVEAADKAAATGKRVELPPMTSSGRRVVHAALGNREDVITRSEGREPNRYIVIIPKRTGDRPNGGGNNNNRRQSGSGGYNNRKNNNKHWNNHGRKNADGKDSGAE